MKTMKRKPGRQRKRTHHLSVHMTASLQWAWNIKAANGKLVAWSGESYKNRVDCVNSVLNLVQGIMENRVSVSDEGLRGV